MNLSDKVRGHVAYDASDIEFRTKFQGGLRLYLEDSMPHLLGTEYVHAVDILWNPDAVGASNAPNLRVLALYKYDEDDWGAKRVHQEYDKERACPVYGLAWVAENLI